jgi:methionyl-tRNA formyltransferase
MILGVLVSGNLGYKVLNELFVTRKIAFVMTDKGSTEIIKFCESRNINLYCGNPRNQKAEIFYSNLEIDILISVNYLFIINSSLIKLPNKFAVNFHGSLLPKYRGRTPHVWAIINNEKVTGITAHLIDNDCDTGDIIHQVKISIDDEETGADILKKFEINYIPLVNFVLDKMEKGDITLVKQEHIKSTYFGKRTSEDGKIDWNWQKERIYNWVRAQAYPYPGAFTFHNDLKIIIDKITFDDYGFNYNNLNGQILALDPVIVKTPNGSVKLESFRNLPNNLKIGDLLK